MRELNMTMLIHVATIVPKTTANKPVKVFAGLGAIVGTSARKAAESIKWDHEIVYHVHHFSKVPEDVPGAKLLSSKIKAKIDLAGYISLKQASQHNLHI
jgi:hypothetical protein